MTDDTLKTYEIHNPSDPYTLRASDPAVAAVACLFLGEGSYGLSDEDGNRTCPIFLLGGNPDTWLKDAYGVSIDDVATKRSCELADVLDSVLIGSLSDRRELDEACKYMTEEAAEKFRDARHDRQRTSLNNIGRRAKSLAAHFRKNAEAAIEATPSEAT